jgi:purine-binding chemotaxis protein CheW
MPPVPAPPEHIARLITPLRGVRRITPMRGTPAVAAARTLRERVRARSGTADLLLFRVAGERFAIDLAAVEEAIDLPPVYHVPEMPPAMLGVITVRGTLTPAYSPQPALGLALTDGASALIFKRGRHRFALVIDDVEDVMTLDLSTLRDAPGVDESESVLLGVVRQRDALLAVVDAESLLATCQAVPLLETA